MISSQLDSFPVANLPDRYHVARSNIYNRLKGLAIKPEKLNDQAILNADQLALMDALDLHLKAGGKISTFEQSDSPLSPVGQIEKSYRTRDKIAIAKQPTQLIALSPEQLIELATAIAPVPPAPISDPFENLEQIERLYRNGWRVSSSQLAPLLNRQSLPGKRFQMFGYRFIPTGKNGREKAWKIEKIDSMPPEKSI